MILCLRETFHSIIDLKSVAVVAIKDDKTFNQQELGYTTDLTPKQLALLKTPNATLDFYIRIAFTAINLQTGQIEDTFDSPHYSVVRDTQATYANGKKALLAFLRTRGQEAVIIEKVEARKLQPAKLHFTVTKHGTLDHIRLDRSSNYPKIDQLMIDLIQQTPDHWIPAKNIKGEQVNQELVVSFGLLGC
ncbi:hypothetical protein N7U66_01805 [Lacinutrix neustonica]|uniref:TonB C-terminal domain-containing protein n=1 Tax=Lacinutrix neustonica TaxID=2980107 RepID=A0A9E8MW63_9FLAO|nr:hypothetical protein [Lacinutrix neustonica]WAC02471.1 hypothetical protein N7U66_01805 [Lacinutrix neustonica]